MIIQFTLEEQELLTHLLYVASKSEQINKRRSRSRLAAPIVQAGFGILFLTEKKYVLGIIFLALSFVWYFAYPFWERKYYVRHYKGFISENQKQRTDNNISLEFTEDHILAKDGGNEGKVPYTEIQSINEISTLILIRLKGGKAFIIPKGKVEDLQTLIGLLEALASQQNVNYYVEPDWEWK